MNIIEKEYSLNGSLQERTKTDMIILHHAVYNGDVEGIDRIHKGNGWTCIGYHFYVRKDGSIYRGRKESTVGAHAYGSNMTSIGICAEGNFEEDVMSEAQKNAIKELVIYLKNKYGISIIKKHKDVNATACPGKNYPFDEIANAKEESKTEVKTDVDRNTVGQHRKLKANVKIWSSPNLNGTYYDYLKNTEIEILENVSENVDKIRVIKTGRVAYINIAWYASAYDRGTVGKRKKLKANVKLWSKPDLTGTSYSYLKNTEVEILENVNNDVDKVKAVRTGRVAYINIYWYK